MPQMFYKLIVDGYHAGEVDFATALIRNPVVHGRVVGLVNSLVWAESHPRDGLYHSVAIVGRSDRVDEPGLSAEARRAKELKASKDRADSVGTWLLHELSRGMSAVGLTPPADFDVMTNVGVILISKGAAELVHTTPASEEQRRENRQIKLMVVSFWPNADRSAPDGEIADSDRRG